MFLKFFVRFSGGNSNKIIPTLSNFNSERSGNMACPATYTTSSVNICHKNILSFSTWQALRKVV
jgi:hypothetical protein